MSRDRTVGQRLVDLLWTRYARLPAATGDGYTVTHDLRIPLRDGVDLLADVHQPKGPVSGTILVTSRTAGTWSGRP